MLLLDADGLIKLHRAGLLGLMAESFSCAIPKEVYHEAVTQGMASRYPDAEAIESIVQRSIKVTSARPSELGLEGWEKPALGRGEIAVLALYAQGVGDVVISDDRAFLNLLTRRGIPFLVPAALILRMVRQRVISVWVAKNALERLRPSIRQAVYHEVMRSLEEEDE